MSEEGYPPGSPVAPFFQELSFDGVSWSLNVTAMDHSAGFLKLVNEARPHVKEISLDQARERLSKIRKRFCWT